MFRRRKGQSSLEYVIILTAIIAAIIAARQLMFKTGEEGKAAGLGKLLEKSTDNITDATGRLPGVGTTAE